MTRRLLPVALLLLVGAASTTFGLELTSGRMRLHLFERTGRFSAEYKPAGGNWTPLFYAQDPRTTVLEIRAGNDLYHMGDSSRFQQKVTKTQTGGEIAWKSDKLYVTETFAFKTSTGASQPDGLLITIKVDNLTSKSLAVGIRYLIDTYLGERNRIEFVTPNEDSMTNETAFTGSQVPTYWVSPENKKLTVGLEAVTRGSGVTVPNRIIFANWKRLYDSQWDYTVDPTRNFNLLPYSINDSAVAMYYNSEELKPGATRTVTMLLGQYSPGGWGTVSPSTASLATAPSPQAASSSTTASSEPNPAVSQLLNEVSKPESAATSTPSAANGTAASDLKTVNAVLQQIQTMLDDPQNVSQADLTALGQVLEKLKARKAELPQK